MNLPTTTLVSFDDQGTQRYGQIYCPLEGELYLVLDPEGKSYITYGWGLHQPAERDAFGRVYWSAWHPGEPVMADPEYVRGATNELLRKPAVQQMLHRILSRRDRKLALRRETCVADSWEIPYAMCVKHGGYCELNGYFLAYLDRPPEDRDAEEAALTLLRDGIPGLKQRRGSRLQWEVVMACYYGDLPLAWIAGAWGVNRSTVTRHYHKGLEFLSYYVPINSARANHQSRQTVAAGHLRTIAALVG